MFLLLIVLDPLLKVVVGLRLHHLVSFADHTLLSIQPFWCASRVDRIRTHCRQLLLQPVDAKCCRALSLFHVVHAAAQVQSKLFVAVNARSWLPAVSRSVPPSSKARAAQTLVEGERRWWKLVGGAGAMASAAGKEGAATSISTPLTSSPSAPAAAAARVMPETLSLSDPSGELTTNDTPLAAALRVASVQGPTRSTVAVWSSATLVVLLGVADHKSHLPPCPLS